MAMSDEVAMSVPLLKVNQTVVEERWSETAENASKCKNARNRSARHTQGPRLDSMFF